MPRLKFFEERTDQSEIKARIVQKYFQAWARVIIPTARKHGGKIGYIDLYAGPGRYKDGAASTPLLVLETAVVDPDMSRMLVTIFNDANSDYSETLTSEIAKIKQIGKLKYKPQIYNEGVDKNIAKYFEEIKLIPTFSFVDPWGYKGLSLKIVNAVIKDWGCDCVFFFNYSRINAGISNPAVQVHIDALFGNERADRLRVELSNLKPHEREALILEKLAQALKGLGGRYVLPFRFRNESGRRTSHCLIFVSKHEKGYEIMKDIMAKESSSAQQGVPSFTYSPADERTPLLFSLTRPLDDLEDLLLERFVGETLTMEQVYKRHHVDRPFLKRNYKQALRNLEAAGKIIADPPAEERRKGTFANHVKVQFPDRS